MIEIPKTKRAPGRQPKGQDYSTIRGYHLATTPSTPRPQKLAPRHDQTQPVPAAAILEVRT